MAELSFARKPIRLSWSEAISGAELYDGEDVDTFATDWHFHEGWQLVAVTRGERHYEFKSTSIIAEPGRVVLVPPRLVHRARCRNQGKTSFRIATLPAFDLAVDAPSAPTSWRAPQFFDAFLSVFELLKVSNKRAPRGSILSGLQNILRGNGAQSNPKAFPPPAFVIRTESYLLGCPEKFPSLDSLSSLAGVSRYHFSHTFTKHVGLAPLAFHARARLIRSRKLISEGCSLADTSLSLSFSDQSHFGRLFKRVYGMTPGEYRENIASGLNQVA